MTKGLNQTQLAQALGIDRTALVRIEKGERRVTALELLDIAGELGRRVEWFLTPRASAIVRHRGTDPEDLAAVRPIDVELETLSGDVALLEELGRLQLDDRPTVLARPGTSAEAEELGLRIRALAGVEDGPVSDLVGVGQRLGLLAFSLDLGRVDADAASMVQGGHGIALINGSPAVGVGRRRLALAHELAHFMVDDQYQTDFRVDARAEADRHENRMDRAARCGASSRRGSSQRLGGGAGVRAPGRRGADRESVPRRHDDSGRASRGARARGRRGVRCRP